jgi:pimeloyl-ACP methyl ester carboxylesterase
VWPQSVFEEMTGQIRDDRAAFFQSFFRSFYGVGMIAQPVAMRYSRTAADGDAGWAPPTLAAAQAFATTDFRGDLAFFDVPTLIIHGTDDETVPIDSTARAAAKAIPGSTLIEYEGSAHGIFASDRERLTRDLIEFLGQNGVSASPMRSEQSAH